MIDRLGSIADKLHEISRQSRSGGHGRSLPTRSIETREDPIVQPLKDFDMNVNRTKNAGEMNVKYGAYVESLVPNRYAVDEAMRNKSGILGGIARPNVGCPPCPPCRPTHCSEDELCRDDSKFASVNFSGKATIGTEIVKMFEALKFAFSDNGEIMAVKYGDICSRVNGGSLEQDLNLGFAVIPADSVIDKDTIVVSAPTVFSSTFEVPAGTEISRDGMMILKDEIIYHVNGDMSIGQLDGPRYTIGRKEIESILTKDYRVGDVVVSLKNGFSTSDGKTFAIAGMDLVCCGARKQIVSIEDKGRVFRLMNGVEIVNEGGVAKAITEFGHIPLRDHRVCVEQSNGGLAIKIDVGKKGYYTIGSEDKNPEQQCLFTPCGTKFTYGGGALNFVMRDKDVYYLDINRGLARQDLSTGDLAVRLLDGSEYLISKDAYCLKEANYCGSDISIELLRNHPFNFEIDKSGQLLFLGTSVTRNPQGSKYGAATGGRSKVALNSAEVEIQQDGSIILDSSIRFPSDNRVVELLDRYGNIVGVITEENLVNNDPNEYKIDDRATFKVGSVTYFSQGYAIVKDVALDSEALTGIDKDGSFILSSGVVIAPDGTAVISANSGGLSGAIPQGDYDVLSNGTLVAGNDERTVSLARDGIKINGVKFPDARILIHNGTPIIKLSGGVSLSIGLNNDAPTSIIDDNGATKPVVIKDIYQNGSFSFLNGIKFEGDKYVLPNGNIVSASQNIHIGSNGELIVKIGENIVYTLDYVNSSPVVTVYGYADANANMPSPVRMDLVDSVKLNMTGDVEFPTGNILHADGSGITVLNKIRIDDSSKGMYHTVPEAAAADDEDTQAPDGTGVPPADTTVPDNSSAELSEFPIAWTSSGSVKVGRIEFNAKDSFIVYNNNYNEAYCNKENGVSRVPAECVRGIESDLCKGGGIGTDIAGTIIVNLINGLSITNTIDAEGEKLLLISNEVGTTYADMGQFPKEVRIGAACNVEIDIENCLGGVLDTYSYDGTEVKRIDPNGSSYAIMSGKWTDDEGDGSLKTITFGSSVYASMPGNSMDHCLVAGDAQYILHITETEECSCDAGRIEIKKPANIQITEITPIRSESFIFQLITGDKSNAKKYGSYQYAESEDGRPANLSMGIGSILYGAGGPIVNSGGNEITKPGSEVPLYPNDVTIGGSRTSESGSIAGGGVKLSEIKVLGGNVVEKASLETLTFDDGSPVKENDAYLYYSGTPIEASPGKDFSLLDLDTAFKKDLFDNDDRIIQRSAYKYLTPRGGILLSCGFTLLPDGAVQTDIDNSGFGKLLPAEMSYCAVDKLTGAFEAPGFVRDITLAGALDNPVALSLDFGTFASGCGSVTNRVFSNASVKYGALCVGLCEYDPESTIEILDDGAEVEVPGTGSGNKTENMEFGTQRRGFSKDIYQYSKSGELVILVNGGRKLYFDGQSYYLDEKPNDSQGPQRSSHSLMPSPVLDENGLLMIQFNENHDLM